MAISELSKLNSFIKAIDIVKETPIPFNVLSRAKLALLDYIGVTLAGYSEQRTKVNKLIRSLGDEIGRIYPVGISAPMGMNSAVFLNGLNGHALDFDDGTNAGIIHLGSPIFSVLLALAQKYNFSGDKLLEAAVIGYETSFTMARSIQPVHKQLGYHATATCGLLGIAMASSMVLGFNKDKTKQAISTAALSATGTLKVLEDGSELKPYNVGKTALLGLVAVQMADAGFRGPDDAFSGVSGYLRQMYGNEKVDFVPCLLDGTYAMEKAYVKPYAACRYTHPSIDVALTLRKQRLVEESEIESVVIRTYMLAVKNHDHTDIKGSASAKMSIPYNFAVTYLTGKTGMDAFTPEILESPPIKRLTRKITVEEDSQMTSLFPKQTVASVSLKFKDGSQLEGKSILPKGEPENPMTEEEVIAKFTSLAVYGRKTMEQAQRIVDAVMNVDSNLPALLSMIR